MSDFQARIRAAASRPRAPGHKAPTTGHVNRGQGVADTSAGIKSDQTPIVLGGVGGRAGAAQREVGNFWNWRPQTHLELRGYREGVAMRATVAGAYEIDPNIASVYEISTAGNVAITFGALDLIPGDQAEVDPWISVGVTLFLARGAGHIPTFPGVMWEADTLPAFATDAAATDILVFVRWPSSGVWYGMAPFLGAKQQAATA